MSSEGAKKLRQEIFGDVSFVPIHLKDSGIAQSMADIVEFEVESRIDAAVAPLVEALRNFLEYDAASEGDVSMTDNDELWQKAETALEQWRGGNGE